MKDDIIKKDYSFVYENKQRYADLAIVNKNNEIKYIIEICDTHVTHEFKRPKNIEWFELKAKDIVDDHKKKKYQFEFRCIRKIECNNCLEIIYEKQKEANELYYYIQELIKNAEIGYNQNKKEEKIKNNWENLFINVFNNPIKKKLNEIKEKQQLIKCFYQNKLNIAKEQNQIRINYVEFELETIIKSKNLYCHFCKSQIKNLNYLVNTKDELKIYLCQNNIKCGSYSNCVYRQPKTNLPIYYLF